MVHTIGPAVTCPSASVKTVVVASSTEGKPDLFFHICFFPNKMSFKVEVRYSFKALTSTQITDIERQLII